MIRLLFTVALAGLLLAGSTGCGGLRCLLTCDSCHSGTCGTDGLACSDAAAPCDCGEPAPMCGSTAGDCDCATCQTSDSCQDCQTCDTRLRLRDCLPFLGSLFRCNGCSSDIYWSGWYSDPPARSDPCDRCGNWTGQRAGSCNTHDAGIGCATCDTGAVTTAPILEPTPVLAAGDRAIRP